MKQYCQFLSIGILIGFVMVGSLITGCSNSGGDDFFPNQGTDFLVFTEIEIETRTADTTAPREINGANFVFRQSELDKVSPLPIPGASLASGG